MNQYKSVNVKLSNSQLNKSKSGIENVAEVSNFKSFIKCG